MLTHQWRCALGSLQMCKDTGRELSEDQKRMLAEIEADAAPLLTRATTAAAAAWLAPTEVPGPNAATEHAG